MKRYRVTVFDFDSTVDILTSEINDEWEDRIKQQHIKSRIGVEEYLLHYYGNHGYRDKRENFIDLGRKPVSIAAFHNRFFEQIRTAFITGAYYPSLTGACALGERILNHLLLVLRDDFKSTTEYKRLARKKSFDSWDVAIDALESWEVLLLEVATEFRRLKRMRNESLHFRPEVDTNDREPALAAINCLSAILGQQFSAFGKLPWFIKSIKGEAYIKKAYESKPFIKRVYLPNCRLVGPKHKIETVGVQFVLKDEFEYEDREISDEEFGELRRSSIEGDGTRAEAND